MHFFIALVCVALPFLAQASSSEATSKTGLSIPISRRSTFHNADGVVDITKLGASQHHTIAKIKRGLDAFERATGGAHPLASKMNRSNGKHRRKSHPSQLAPIVGNTGSVPLTQYSDTVWYGSITVGSPGNTFTVQFDTGSSDLFLPDVSCGATCQGHNRYDPQKSFTAQDIGKTTNLSFGDQSWAFVKQYKDTVTLGGYTATGQELGSATISFDFNPSIMPSDGLMGMGYPSISDFQASPVFQTLVAEGQVPEPVFAFYIAQSESELFIGGTNEKYYTGSFTYVPVDQQGFWQVMFDNVGVNGKHLLGATSAIIDTGTSRMFGDPDTVRTVYDNIPGSALIDGIWTIPCSSNVAMSITFDGTEFAISPDTFNIGPLDSNDNSHCVGALGAQADLEFWILGDTFLRNVYTVFDIRMDRVGFASLPSA